MITIESLVDMGANVRLEVTPTDLKMFAESIIQRTIVAQQEEQKAAMQREAEETYLNTKQVRELLNVCEGTLNLWAKRECGILLQTNGEVIMGIRQLDICNRVMAQAQGIAESDFPIDAFPAKVQSVILGMVRHENFKVEYLATAMLSAVQEVNP